jgi:hypothetical protein
VTAQVFDGVLRRPARNVGSRVPGSVSDSRSIVRQHDRSVRRLEFLRPWRAGSARQHPPSGLLTDQEAPEGGYRERALHVGRQQLDKGATASRTGVKHNNIERRKPASLHL